MNKSKFSIVSAIPGLTAAVLSGMLLITLNSVFAEPTASPEDSAGVHPTFSGITLENPMHGAGVSFESDEGALVLDGVLSVLSGAGFAGNTSVQGSFSVGDNLRIKPNVVLGTDPSTQTEVTLGKDNTANTIINGTLEIMNNMYLRTGSNLMTSTGVDVEVGGDLFVNQDTTLSGLTVGGGTLGTPNTNLYGPLRVYNNTTTNGLTVGADGVNTVMGDLDLNASTGNGVNIGGDLTINGSIDGNVAFGTSLTTTRVFGPLTYPTTASTLSSVSECTTGTLIGCNAYAGSKDINIYKVYPSGNRCYAYATDDVESTSYFRSVALCLE